MYRIRLADGSTAPITSAIPWTTSGESTSKWLVNIEFPDPIGPKSMFLTEEELAERLVEE